MMFDIEQRVKEARRLFKEEGYNCCQAVVIAYCDIFGIDKKTAASISSGFGGGMGRMREVCGSVSGMIILAGLLKPAHDPSSKADRTANYALVQDVAGEFKQINGSIICRDLLGIGTSGRDNGSASDTGSTQSMVESPVPADRTNEYYKKRPCEELVGISARIIGKRILLCEENLLNLQQ
ncbi:MAG: C_GCAxxG_C_C family protein [Bacteroidales bacterium]|nr:C_GCAxxG_C_C family protein [Bacteroidales bacterium]MBQ6688190.1 C_GCAxxG_C_C family protein [Bacteroidales bacterium]